MNAKLFGNLAVSGALLVLLTYVLAVTLIIASVGLSTVIAVSMVVLGVGAVLIFRDVRRLDTCSVRV